MNQAARRYALALFKSAKDTQVVDEIQQQLHLFEDAIDHHHLLKNALFNPLLNKREVAEALKELAQYNKFSSLVSNLLQILVSQKRLSLIPEIIKIFDDIIDQEQGIVHAFLTSADPMSSPQKKVMTDLLEEKLSSRIKLQEKIDRTLLGGYILQVGPYLFNNTLNYKLNKLNQSLKKVI